MADPQSSQDAQHPEGEPRTLTAEQVRRWAKLIARGESPMPASLAAESGDQLLKEVRRLRRQHMVNVIARAIARDLMKNRTGMEATDHD